jgi:hypothetical protein
VNARLLGTVLNAVPQRARGYGYGYGYGEERTPSSSKPARQRKPRATRATRGATPAPRTREPLPGDEFKVDLTAYQPDATR